jgi:hypothetical protein
LLVPSFVSVQTVPRETIDHEVLAIVEAFVAELGGPHAVGPGRLARP